MLSSFVDIRENERTGFCANPLVPRTRKMLVGHPGLQYLEPYTWTERCMFNIPIDIFPDVVRGLPLDTVALICKEEDKTSWSDMKRRILRMEPESEDRYVIMRKTLYSEAARQGRLDLLPKENISQCVSFEDALRGGSEKILAIYDMDSMRPLDVLTTALRAGNLDVSRTFMKKAFGETTPTLPSLFHAAVQGGNLECVSLVGTPDVFTEDDIVHVCQFGTLAIHEYVRTNLFSNAPRTEEFMDVMLEICSIKDDSEVLDIYIAETDFSVTYKTLQNAVQYGGVRCLSLLLSKYSCTPIEIQYLGSEIQYARLSMSLWPLEHVFPSRMKTIMTADDVWIFLDWVICRHEVASRSELFLDLLVHATGDEEFKRIRKVVLGWF